MTHGPTSIGRIGGPPSPRIGPRRATGPAGGDRGRITRIEHLAYGADYNPEQWPEDVWQEDARLMRAAGVNLVSLGIFAWARVEPAPGRYEFGWLDRIIDLLHEHGVAVNLATPTASPPPWLIRQHPEVLPVTADGVTLWHGSRRHYCPHAPAYRERAALIARAIAERYRDHPALVLWHVDNEYACHVTECFCDPSAAAFRAWLRERHGSLDVLNDAWGTAFWSQTYSHWEEIAPPRRMPALVNPSQQLDWRRFSSDSWRACFTDQASILREVTPSVPVLTNFMGFFKPVDYWAFAADEDVVANDMYPDTSDPGWPVDAAMTNDLMRSLGGGRPWMLMEQAAAHVNWRARNATKRPGVMRLGSLQAVARGAEAVMFFQWRASRAGAESYHSAMIPHGGPRGRTWQEVNALGAELAGLDGLLGSRVAADAAILVDWESWWALETEGKPSNEVRLVELVREWYAELFGRNVTVDFAHPAADLSRYRLVFAPTLYLVDEPAVANLRGWVAGGGTLVMSFFSGIVDANDHVRLGGYPQPFADVLGLIVDEWAPQPPDAVHALRTSDGRDFRSTFWCDVVRLEGAEALANYADDFFADFPAVTSHRHGDGTAFYVGTRLDAAGTGWVVDHACTAAGIIVGERAPAGVEILRRTDGSRSWTFVLNHSTSEVEVPVHGTGITLRDGARVDGSVCVGPVDVAIIFME